MRVTAKNPSALYAEKPEALGEVIANLLELTSSALYLADLREKTISLWNAGESFACADIAGLFQRSGVVCRDMDEAFSLFVEGIFSGKERGRIVRRFSPLLGGDSWRAEFIYKTLRGEGGSPEAALCVMRRLRMGGESEPLCDEYRSCLREWLKRGVENDYIKLYLQPKVNLASGAVIGAEVLARYDDPREGLILPDAFVPELEKAELAEALDLYIFERSYMLLDRLRELGKAPLPLSVNFSKNTLLAPDILEKVKNIESGFAGLRKYMEIELTESVGDVSRSSFAAACAALREAGYRLALDDFGSEYSNLYMMSAFRFDVIKIDKAIVAEVEDNEISRLIVESTAKICAKLGVSCIAEGVERKEQADILAGLGCLEAQGYLIDKPLPCAVFCEKYLGCR